MLKQRILITGASGYLAHRLVPIAATYGEVVGVARCAGRVYPPAKAMALDMTDTNAIRSLIASVKPTAIIHAAAVNPGAGNDELMDQVNHQAAKALAQSADRLNCRLVMVSTESVHRGDAAPYSDHDEPDPINAYGHSKAAGECEIMRIKPDAAIARTSLIYALTKMDNGTAGFRDRLARGEQLVLFDDVLRQPVWADSLAHALCHLATKFTAVSGPLNVMGDEVLSRAEFALKMLAHWQIETGANYRLRSGVEVAGVQQDLRCDCPRARALGLLLPGVTEVLSRHANASR